MVATLILWLEGLGYDSSNETRADQQRERVDELVHLKRSRPFSCLRLNRANKVRTMVYAMYGCAVQMYRSMNNDLRSDLQVFLVHLNTCFKNLQLGFMVLSNSASLQHWT